MDIMEFKKIIKVTRLKKVGNNKELSTAYHEAGHVLINLLYGLPGTRTTIIPDERKNSAGSNEHTWNESGDYDFSGYIFDYCLDNDIEEWDRQKEIDYLVITQMAGIIGGAFYSGRYNWPGAARDFEQVIDHFLGYGINDIQNLQEYWDKTFDLITANKAVLIKIASDLYKFKILDAEYFKMLSI